MSNEAKDFVYWIPTVYEPCGQHDWKYRYPKTTDEMTMCFTVEEVYMDFIQKRGVNNSP